MTPGIAAAADRSALDSVAPPAPAEIELVLARARLLAQLRVEWLRTRSAIGGASGGRRGIPHDEVAGILADDDRPADERAWQAQNEQAQERCRGLQAIEDRLASLDVSRLGRLKQLFGLTAAEIDLLQLALATAIDPSLSRVWAYLHHSAGRADLSDAIAVRVLRQGRTPAWTEDSALFRWDLVHRVSVNPAEADALVCDPVVRDWFLDRDALDPVLASIARDVPAPPPIDGWPVDEAVDFIDRAVHAAGGRVRCVIGGPARSGRHSFAAAVAARLAMPILGVDVDGLDDDRWRAVFVRAQRYAYLYRCALAWSGDAIVRHPWPNSVPAFPIQFAIVDGGIPPAAEHALDRVFTLPPPTVATRERLWHDLVPQAHDWPDAAVRELAARYRSWPGDIAAIAAEHVRSPEDAAIRLRESARGRLGDLAQLLECPFAPSDLVVPPPVRDALDDFRYEAGARSAFWDRPGTRRLFPQGRGLVGLFSGPPGTGKTMAAQVIAGGLAMDLYRIDYAAMVSKWVGETAKNVQLLLQRAASMDCVLLFDEADAMFARRSSEIRDAQDKFANTDASHLMVAVESYGGVVILASNLKGNIDPAFVRRIRYVIDFPKPDAGERLEIWNKLVTALAGDAARVRLQRELAQLAADVEATGSQIKFGLLGALFAAERDGREIALGHLVRGLNRELAKEGRGLSDRERDRIAANVR